MKKKIKAAISHPLISGSAVIFTGSLIGNIINFAFNVFMSRTLSRSDYGILASLVSIILISALVAESFIPVVVNFATKYFLDKEYDLVYGLFLKITKLSAIIGGFFLTIFVVFAEQISTFLNIQDKLIIGLVGIAVLFIFIGVVNRALLQAKLAFHYIAFTVVVASVIKLLLGVTLVYLGYKVYGAIFAFFLVFFIPYALSFFPLRIIFTKKLHSPHISATALIKYGIPSALAILGLTSFITTDLILVKHFFDPDTAGFYAVMSLVGRIIFFFSAPIGMVMFPLIIKKHTKNENYHGDFRLAMLLVFCPSLVLTILYFLFPRYIILPFIKQEEILEYSKFLSLLGYFGIVASFYSFISVMTNFFLSIQKTKVFIPIITLAIIQGVMIWFYHDTFLTILLVSLFCIGLLFVVLLVYYGRVTAKQKSAKNFVNIYTSNS